MAKNGWNGHHLFQGVITPVDLLQCSIWGEDQVLAGSWKGEKPLAPQFPDLFKCANDRNAIVHFLCSHYEISSGLVFYLQAQPAGPWRNPIYFLDERSSFFHIQGIAEDRRAWRASGDGTFSVSFSIIKCGPKCRISTTSIRKFKSPPGVAVFGWLAL